MIPDKVKIGSYEYDVVLTNDPILVDNRLCAGSITYSDLRIEIKEDMAEQRKWQTLFHEIIHGIVEERNIELDTAKPELIVDELAYGVLRFIKDNPDIVKMLSE